MCAGTVPTTPEKVTWSKAISWFWRQLNATHPPKKNLCVFLSNRNPINQVDAGRVSPATKTKTLKKKAHEL